MDTVTISTDKDIDKRKSKIDVVKALKLRIVNKLSYQEIADQFDCSKQAVHDSLQRFTAILDNPELKDNFDNVEPTICRAIKLKHYANMLDDETVKKSSSNNSAYTVAQINTIQRLAEDKSTANIAYQDISGQLDAINQELAKYNIIDVQPQDVVLEPDNDNNNEIDTQ